MVGMATAQDLLAPADSADPDGLTLEQYDAICAATPADGRRWELLEGTLVVTPAPFMRHQVGVTELARRLYFIVPEDLYAISGPIDVRFGFRTNLEPDLVVVRRSSVAGDPDRLPDPPAVVVEVQSRSTRCYDRGAKRLAYAGMGIPAYWLLDPGDPSRTALVLRDGEYVEHATGAGDVPVEITEPFAARIVPGELFGPLA